MYVQVAGPPLHFHISVCGMLDIITHPMDKGSLEHIVMSKPECYACGTGQQLLAVFSARPERGGSRENGCLTARLRRKSGAPNQHIICHVAISTHNLASIASITAFASTMFSCRCQREQPHQVPTDEVIPARFFDDTPMVRGVVMRWMARFNDVLDAKKLHLALVKLLETGSWKRLGGRLRLNV